jgi:hypothetical protein
MEKHYSMSLYLIGIIAIIAVISMTISFTQIQQEKKAEAISNGLIDLVDEEGNFVGQAFRVQGGQLTTSSGKTIKLSKPTADKGIYTPQQASQQQGDPTPQPGGDDQETPPPTVTYSIPVNQLESAAFQQAQTAGGFQYVQNLQCTESQKSYCSEGKKYTNTTYSNCTKTQTSMTCPVGTKCENGECKTIYIQTGGMQYTYCTDSQKPYCSGGLLKTNITYQNCTKTQTSKTCPAGQTCPNGKTACEDKCLTQKPGFACKDVKLQCPLGDATCVNNIGCVKYLCPGGATNVCCPTAKTACEIQHPGYLCKDISPNCPTGDLSCITNRGCFKGLCPGSLTNVCCPEIQTKSNICETAIFGYACKDVASKCPTASVACVNNLGCYKGLCPGTPLTTVCCKAIYI